MIARNDLRKIADRKHLSVVNAEKDYLLDVLLFQIVSETGDSLVLKGGTSLYKLYNLNRFSEDLDFTLNRRRFDEEAFVRKILRRLALDSINGDAEEAEISGNEINVSFRFRGPLYDGSRRSLCRIALNISRRERILREPKRELIVPSSREVPSFQAYVMDEAEIAAEKVRAIMTRNKPRDVYDLWFLIKRGVALDKPMIDSKLRLYNKTFSRREFSERIEEKKTIWEIDLRGLIMGELPDFKKIRDEVLAQF